jgi:ribosome-associated protein
MLKINNPAVDSILDVADSKQASDIIVLDVSNECDFTDLFIIMSAETKRQIKSIVNELISELKLEGYDKIRVDGNDNLEWVVVDYGDFIVHIFDEQNREKYLLESVWENSKQIIRIH